jgi:PAS domain S-box-containing protein
MRAAAVFFFGLMTLSAMTAEPKRVLILDPYERDVAPFSIVASSFRTTLARDLGGPAEFFEVPLDLARFAGPEGEGPLVEFLDGRVKSQPVDLVVPIGGVALQFVMRHRERLFPNTPILVVSGDSRLITPGFLRTNATFVTYRINLSSMVEDILQLQPQTTNIVVVFGASALETFWVNECRREFQTFTNRVGFTWLNGLSLDDIVTRCGALPPHSFILHGLFVVDGAGVPCEKNEALRRLHRDANAPLFGYMASELGLGPIGGRLYPDAEIGAQGARTAIRILRGEKPESIPPQVFETAAPVYDWRELQRWRIPESRLPAGSVIKFRGPTIWGQYRWHIIGVFVFCCLQTVLIVGLFVNRIRRREADTVGALIAELSSKFIHLSASEVDREIEDAQRRVCECLGLDISSLWQWMPEQPDTLIMTHLYRRLPGPATPERFDAKEYFPWALQQLKAGRIVALSTNNVPAEAARDLEVWRHFGLKTVLNLPMTVGAGVPVGLVAFNDTRADREWTDLLVQRLQLVAQVFANALARKRADQALHESEERMTLAAEAAQFGVWGWNIDRNQVWGSEKWQRLFGFASGDAVSFEKVMQRIHPDDRETVEREVRRALANGSDYVGEFRTVLPDGIQRWIISRGRGYRDASGKPARMMGTAVDNTERKQTEAELLHERAELAHVARVSTVGALAGTLAHELNQPLNAILNNAQAGSRFLAGKTPDLAEVRGALEDIAQDTKRAGEVIRQIRAFVKKDEPKFQSLDLNRVVEEVVRLLHSDSQVRKVRIALELAPNLPPVRGDNVQVQQVVVNLLLNAFDAMKEVPERERTVLLRTRRPEAASLQVSITDHGTGVSPERLVNLFEPFRSSKHEGLGLGLSISHSIIEAHRGRLWAENNPARGATFYFTLPVQAAELKLT